MEEFAWFIGVLLEFALDIGGELVAEISLRRSGRALGRPKSHTAWAVVGYLILVAALGAVSLLIFPRSLIEQHGTRRFNLLLTPILAGAVMSILGTLLRRRGKRTIRLDSFFYGALFAFGFVLVRFLFATSK